MPDDPTPGGPRPGRDASTRLIVGTVIAAVVLTLTVVGVGLFWARHLANEPTGPDTGPLAVPAALAPGADGRSCAALMADLPDDLVGEPRRELVTPEPGVAAWGDPAIILRCGIPDPAELTCAAPLTQFTSASGASVTWLRLQDASAITFIAVDRPVRIAVTLPPGAGVGPVQQMSETIAAALPAQPVCTNGQVTPTDDE